MSKSKRPVTMIRVIRNTSAGIVAGIAGYASYWHQVHVALMAGERVELAHILPGSVDGLLAVSSIAMVDARAEGRRPSWKVYVGFWAGIVASVGANVMSAQPTPLGRIVAAWPSVALLLVVEGLASKGRKLRRSELVDDESATTVEAPAKTEVTEPVSVAALASAMSVAPVSPGPTGGRPLIPTTVLADGQVVRTEDGGRVSTRTAQRRRGGK
jgi:hypothetical protein